MQLKIVINVPRIAYAKVNVECRLRPKLHKTKAYDEKTEIFRCYSSTESYFFAQLFSLIVNETIINQKICMF